MSVSEIVNSIRNNVNCFIEPIKRRGSQVATAASQAWTTVADYNRKHPNLAKGGIATCVVLASALLVRYCGFFGFPPASPEQTDQKQDPVTKEGPVPATYEELCMEPGHEKLTPGPYYGSALTTSSKYSQVEVRGYSCWLNIHDPKWWLKNIPICDAAKLMYPCIEVATKEGLKQGPFTVWAYQPNDATWFREEKFKADETPYGLLEGFMKDDKAHGIAYHFWRDDSGVVNDVPIKYCFRQGEEIYDPRLPSENNCRF